MTAVLFTGAGQPLQRVAQSTAQPAGEAIRVRVLCCTLCQSDLATFTGRRIEATPTVLGHEVVGAIEAFGPTAKRVDASGASASIGDRVTWAVVAHCGHCFPCTHGLPQKCERGVKYGHVATDPAHADGGGLADTITLVPGTTWYRIPDGLSTPVASLANCAGATVAAVLEVAGPLEGASVLIFGAGLLGILASTMASSQGAKTIVAVDPDSGCRDRAMGFGATHAFEPGDPDISTAIGTRGADVALELAGRSETVAQCLASVRIGGTVVLAGTVSPTPLVPLDSQAFVRKMLTLRGVHNYQPRHLKTALDFLAGAGRKFPLESLIAASYPLDRVEDAFAAALETKGRRVAVTPDGGPQP